MRYLILGTLGLFGGFCLGHWLWLGTLTWWLG